MMYVFVYVLSCCFFKQKTAYEMRISDWSSDVCSSDLIDDNRRPDLGALLSACRTVGRALRPGAVVVFESTVYPGVTEEICGPALAEASGLRQGTDFTLGYSPERINPGDHDHTLERVRSEEHTSELQSLMRISYAVFCMKKK